jgi:hypothetical protein
VARRAVRRPAPLYRRLRFEPPVVAVQDHVEGRQANRAVVCWQGRVLAGITVEVLHGLPGLGPSSVVRALRHGAIEEAVRRLVGHLGLSGFVGFDFILDAAVPGRAWLLEMNPRATPAHCLSEPERPGLPSVLLQACAGAAVEPAAQAAEKGVREGRVFVLFPQELQRDRWSPYLNTADHQVPWDEPELVRHCVRSALRTAANNVARCGEAKPLPQGVPEAGRPAPADAVRGARAGQASADAEVRAA